MSAIVECACILELRNVLLFNEVPLRIQPAVAERSLSSYSIASESLNGDSMRRGAVAHAVVNFSNTIEESTEFGPRIIMVNLNLTYRWIN